MLRETAAVLVPFSAFLASQFTARPLAVILGKVGAFTGAPGTHLGAMIDGQEPFGDGRAWTSGLNAEGWIGQMTFCIGPTFIGESVVILSCCLVKVGYGGAVQICYFLVMHSIQSSSDCSYIVHA